jgi:16S rRNA (cytidine1402-2'-O)-methyltransferase
MKAAPAARGTLYVVGTPIGNLEDLTARARKVLATVDVIAAEDTRRIKGLLSTIAAEARVIAYYEHNEEKRVPELIERLASGADVALVSDAGTPLISDPGWRLVHAARAAGLDVVPIPGPSAALVALSVAGLPTDRFVFEGFLPRREAARAARLRELRSEKRTLVLFEAVHRMTATMAGLAEQLGADRQAVVARELTKIHEQVRAGTLRELASDLGLGIPLLGEFVIVVAGDRSEAPRDESRAKEIYATLAAELEPSKALRLTASITGVPRNELYRLVRT